MELEVLVDLEEVAYSVSVLFEKGILSSATWLVDVFATPTPVNETKVPHDPVFLQQYSARYLKGLCVEQAKLSTTDPFHNFLLGLELIRCSDERPAKDALALSVRRFPCNWEAWSALASICTLKDIPQSLPDHWMKQFFMIEVYLRCHHVDEALEVLEELRSSEAFYQSLYVETKLAIALYCRCQEGDNQLAMQIFERVRTANEFYTTGLDTYSSLLFVEDEPETLSWLVRDLMDLQCAFPELCIVIGNYHSLVEDHELAIEAFTRAVHLVDLDRSIDRSTSIQLKTTALTLMGHEYMELSNLVSAKHSYLKALSLDKFEYRAWCGMSRVFDEEHKDAALYYIRKAVQLRPFDDRMWDRLEAVCDTFSRPDVLDSLRQQQAILQH